MSQVIPEQWEKVSLDNIGLIQTGNTPSKKNPEYYGGLFPIFKPTDLNSTQVITKAGEYLSDKGKSVARRIPADSTYVTCIGATIGKTGFVAVEGTCNQQINTISPYEGINPKWVYYWLISPKMNYEVISSSSSTTLPIINKSRFSNLATVLPPLAEQKVIADKLDELLEQVESTKARLDAIPAILKSFRQSVLKAAVSGKLTEEWRGENEYLNAPSLSEIEELWVSRYKVSDKNFKKPKVTPIQNELMKLPSSWLWTQIGLACDVYVGATPSRKNEAFWNGNINWVSSSEVAFCRINETKETITNEGLKGTSTNIHPKGTVMLAMIGQGKTRGQPAILDIEACHNQNTAALRVLDNHCLSEYLYYFLYERYEETRRVGSGNNQQAMNKTVVQSLAFPLPPIEEQTEIVRLVDQYFAFANKVEAQVNAAQAHVNNLTQSILAKAFRGELTKEWRTANPDLISGENSAEALLERIKAECETLTTKSKPSKSRKKVIADEG